MPTSNLTDQTTSGNLTGEELFANFRCTSCHGNDYKGTKKGPSLIGVGEYYSRKDLISYLRNPDSFMDSKRLKDYREQYPGIIMPSYSNKDVKELGKIADFLLGL